MRILVINPFGGGEASARENFDAIKPPADQWEIPRTFHHGPV